MKLRKLITTKPHRYGTRHLTAGDEYEVPPRHAIALVASRKAKFADDKPAAKVEPFRPAPAVTESNNSIAGPAQASEIDRLRQEATQLGIDIDGRWGEPRLRHEIEQAKR
jgi:hypothetical protein